MSVRRLTDAFAGRVDLNDLIIYDEIKRREEEKKIPGIPLHDYVERRPPQRVPVPERKDEGGERGVLIIQM